MNEPNNTQSAVNAGARFGEVRHLGEFARDWMGRAVKAEAAAAEFREASRHKAGWLLETRNKLAAVIAERDALIAALKSEGTQAHLPACGLCHGMRGGEVDRAAGGEHYTTWEDCPRCNGTGTQPALTAAEKAAARGDLKEARQFASGAPGACVACGVPEGVEHRPECGEWYSREALGAAKVAP